MMENLFRAILFKLLGQEKYLSLVSNIYIRLIKAGFMKNKYPELFYLKDIVKPGFVCLDIGANVGYYSAFLSLYAGKSGHVYAVEPVELFANVFTKNTAEFGLDNITLYRTALGGENKTIQMGTPVIDGVFRHGLTHVLNENEAQDMSTCNVEMHIPDELFSSLSRFDFMKCDVEGYEIFILPHFIKTLGKFKPMIQMEISTEENRKQIFEILFPFGYSAYRLSNYSLEKMSTENALHYDSGDFYFRVS